MITKEYYHELNHMGKLNENVYNKLRKFLGNTAHYDITATYKNGGGSNRGMAEQLVLALTNKCYMWAETDDDLAVLFNLRLLAASLEILGAKVPLVYPTFEKLRSTKPLYLYIESVKDPMVTLYKDTIVEHMEEFLPPIEAGDYSNLYLPFPTGTDLIYDLDSLYNGYQNEFNSDKEKLEYIFICFSIAMRYEATQQGLIINKFKSLLRFESILTMTDHELDFSRILGNLKILKDSILGLAANAKSHNSPRESPFPMNIPFYMVKHTEIPDIVEVNQEYGLFVQLLSHRLFIFVMNKEQDEILIAKGVIYEQTNVGYEYRQIKNLYNYAGNPLGNAVIDILDSMGMKDLFYQKPMKGKTND